MLGCLVWFDVPTDLLLDREEYAEAVSTNEAALPAIQPANLADTFRRATEDYKTTDVVDGVTHETFFEKTPNNSEFVERILMTTSDEGHAVVRSAAGSLVFDRASGKITQKDVPDEWGFGVMNAAQNAVEAFIREHNGSLYYQPLRTALVKAIEGPLMGITAKATGSVYYVPESHTEALQRIVDTYNDLPPMAAYTVRVTDEVAASARLDTSVSRWYARISADFYKRLAKIEAGEASGKFIIDTENMLQDAVDRVNLYNALPGTDFLKEEIVYMIEDLTKARGY